MTAKEIIAEVEKLAPVEREEVLAAVRRLTLLASEEATGNSSGETEENLWDVLSEFAGKADGGMPSDMSINLDHYLYGTPKRKP